jgi:hypothetical protein
MKSLRRRGGNPSVLLDFCRAASEAPKVKTGARVTLTLASE